MRVEIGRSLGRHGEPGAAFCWAPDDLINGHMVITGDSGTGKTHSLRGFCRQIAQTAGSEVERVHIFDSHGDIDVPGSLVEFSQSTPYAFNPLEICSDRHFGGVRRSIANFIGMLQRSSRKLGPTQESVLRNLLMDCYQMRGFHPDNPASWGVDGEGAAPENLPADRRFLDIPFEEKEIAKDVARREGMGLQFDTNLRCWWTPRHEGGLLRWPAKNWGKQYPTIHDVISLAQFKLKQVFVGTDNKGLYALEHLCRTQASLVAKVKNTLRRSGVDDPEVLQAERDRAAEKASDAVNNFIRKVATGNELEDLIRYESADTLKSLLDRLDNLKATGVCRSVPPPFDPSELVWRYGLRPYGDDEKRMFVENRLDRLFQSAVARGEVPSVREVVIIDEAPKFMSEESDHIICRVINEGRKFGIALFLISQSPTQFPEQVLAGVGCKIVLGLDPMFWSMAARKLALDQKFIEQIQPRRLILVNQKLKSSGARWYPVQLN